MTYKWTMVEVDDVEMPMLFCLLREIGETPPQDFLANAEIRARQKEVEQQKKSALTTFHVEKGKVRRKKDGD